MKRFIVVLPKEDGGIEVHPMKEWLRQHPENVLPPLDPTTSNSHQLRDGLKRLGWTVQELDGETRLIMPGTPNVEAAVGSVLGEVPDGDEADSSGPAFGLEYQLRDFISQNMSKIRVEDKQLRLYVDPTGRDGVEYPTAIGLVDLLAVDDAGAFVVFELKRARTADRAVGQLTRYMGWVRHTIGRGKEVRGVIVAKYIDDRLRYAASVIPHVSLFEYEVEFHLRVANALPAPPSRSASEPLQRAGQ